MNSVPSIRVRALNELPVREGDYVLYWMVACRRPRWSFALQHAAARAAELDKPLVVRLEGTNVDLGKKIMAESGLTIIAADNLADAAEKIVTAVKEAA